LGEDYTNQNNILGMRYIEAIKGADSGKWLKDRIVDFKGQYRWRSNNHKTTNRNYSICISTILAYT